MAAAGQGHEDRFYCRWLCHNFHKLSIRASDFKVSPYIEPPLRVSKSAASKGSRLASGIRSPSSITVTCLSASASTRPQCEHDGQLAPLEMHGHCYGEGRRLSLLVHAISRFSAETLWVEGFAPCLHDYWRIHARTISLYAATCAAL